MGFFKDLFGGSSESAPPVVPVPTVEDDPYYDRNNDPAMGIFDGGTIAAMLKAGQNLAVGDTAENQWSGNDEVVEVIAPYWNAEIPNLVSTAAEDAGTVNAWLQEQGMEIKLQDQGPGVYMAAVQSATMLWQEKGRAADLDIASTGERVPGFVLEGEQVEVFEDFDGHSFARIATKGAHVYVCPVPEGYECVSGIELIDAARALVEMTQEAKQSRNYSGIHLPCVDYAGGCSLKPALGGMTLGSFEIREALTALSLKMNRFGAADKVASAAGGFESMPRYFVVDGPFFYFRTAPWSDLPLVTAVIPVSGFKDPGDDAIAA